jgi:PKD repeat protein
MRTKILFLMLFAFSAIKMHGQCQAGFYIYEDSLNAPHTYIGVNTSVVNALANYTWVWGDNNVDTGANPSHTYAQAGNYNICLVVMSGGCVDSFCSNENINKVAADIYSITFGAAPAGVNDITKAANNKVYPNPATDLLFINDEKAGSMQYDIYTVSGSRVMSGVVTGRQGISVSSLPVNMYLIKMTDSKGKAQYSKFTKQ